jgi:hypothetical protein
VISIMNTAGETVTVLYIAVEFWSRLPTNWFYDPTKKLPRPYRYGSRIQPISGQPCHDSTTVPGPYIGHSVSGSVPNNQLIATFDYLFDWIGDYSFFDWLFNCQLIGQK